MSQYVEFFLLGLLIVIINNVPEFMCSAVNNKVMLLLLILLNIYLLRIYGISSGILFAVILVVVLNKGRVSMSNQEGFVPKISTWRPANFTSPCQVDLDRRLKESSEVANIASTKQLDGNTNGVSP